MVKPFDMNNINIPEGVRDHIAELDAKLYNAMVDYLSSIQDNGISFSTSYRIGLSALMAVTKKVMYLGNEFGYGADVERYVNNSEGYFRLEDPSLKNTVLEIMEKVTVE